MLVFSSIDSELLGAPSAWWPLLSHTEEWLVSVNSNDKANGRLERKRIGKKMKMQRDNVVGYIVKVWDKCGERGGRNSWWGRRNMLVEWGE